MSTSQKGGNKGKQSQQPCRNFASNGTCKFGAKCRFSHAIVITQTQSPSERSTSKTGTQGTPQPQKHGVCFKWQRGKCNRGDTCKYLHIQDDQMKHTRQAQLVAERAQRDAERELERRHKEELDRQEALRKARQAAAEEERRRVKREQDAARLAAARLAEERAAERRKELLARRAETFAAEAAVTLKHIAFGTTIVKFAAGLEICDIITGFESCRVQIKRLPLNAKIAEVTELFTSQGLEVGRFHILGLKRAGDKQEADVIVESESGTALALGLDGIDFRGETLSFQTSTGSEGGMGASAGRNPRVLFMSWRAPSVRYVATFDDMAEVEAKVRQLNGKTCGGRRVKVEKNTCPPGPAARYWKPNSISISNLPTHISHAEVALFSGTYTLRQLNPVVYHIETAIEDLQRIMEGHAAEPVVIRSINHTADGRITAEAQFSTWEHAKRAHDSLSGIRHLCIGGSTIFVRLPDPHYYTITIHQDQYTAQRAQWDYLVKTTDGDKCRVQIVPRTYGQERIQIRVLGNDKQVVGTLKVRVENLVRGERFDGWHRMFTSHVGRKFLARVFGATGAFAEYDRKVQAIKVCGDTDSMERAQEMIRKEMERLASEERTVKLKRQSIVFFLREGLTVLQEAFGEDCVTLNTASSPAEITVRGGEEPRHMLDRLITDSLDELKYSPVPTTDEIVCPICYVGVSSPEQLGCGHTYCSSCLRHYLTSATDSALFPLTCMGDEDRCKVPIPIPTIQRFLTAQKMDQLLQSAFTTYIDKHLQEFKYCGTPDCGQVYRTAQDGSSKSTLQCPSCFASVCNACGEEGHEGMTCEDYKLQSDPTEQERMTEAFAKEHNFKKCPSCQVWMEKIDGCNHMTCKCGAHVCWVCMKSYPRDIIYQHMTQAHGSIGVDDQVPFVNDIERERQVLENYRLANRMRQEQEQFRTQQQIQRQEAIRRQEQQRRQEEARERERAAAQRQVLLQRYQAVQTEREAAQRYATYTPRQAGTATNQPYIRAQPQPRKEESGSWCVVM